MFKYKLGKIALAGLIANGTMSVNASATCEENPTIGNNTAPGIQEDGLYWFKTNTDLVQASDNPGLDYFDPSKPTLIFIHGKQNKNRTDNGFFERFDYKHHDCKHGFDDDLVAIWRNDTPNHENVSWNVGAFYWHEEATTTIPNMEEDIWLTGQIPDKFIEDYKAALSGYNGEIRIAGHSMGNQVALAVSKKIVEDNALPNPERVALLDPYYDNSYLTFLNFSIDYALNDAKVIDQNGVAIEIYRTSLTTASGYFPNTPAMLSLLKISAQTDLEPLYVSDINPIDNVGNKHIAAPYLYFQSMKYEPAAAVQAGRWTCRWFGCWWDANYRSHRKGNALSASTPNNEVRSMMGNQYYWEQVTDERYANTKKDQFERKRRW